jgi:hypothetical protein
MKATRSAEVEEELPRLNELQQKELNQLVEGLGGWDEDTCPEPVYVKHPDALGTSTLSCPTDSHAIVVLIATPHLTNNTQQSACGIFRDVCAGKTLSCE